LTNNDLCRRRKYPLDAWAWFLQGEGFKAPDKSDGGDIVKAASCFQIAKKLVRSCVEILHFFHELTFSIQWLSQDPDNEDYATEVEEVIKKLTHAQSSAVLSVINEQQLAVEHGLTIDADEAAENIFFVKGIMRYDCDKLGCFGAAARRSVKETFARGCDIGFKDVLIERVSLCSERKLKVSSYLISRFMNCIY
jgi:hypothetical protein